MPDFARFARDIVPARLHCSIATDGLSQSLLPAAHASSRHSSAHCLLLFFFFFFAPMVVFAFFFARHYAMLAA